MQSQNETVVRELYPFRLEDVEKIWQSDLPAGMKLGLIHMIGKRRESTVSLSILERVTFLVDRFEELSRPTSPYHGTEDGDELFYWALVYAFKNAVFWVHLHRKGHPVGHPWRTLQRINIFLFNDAFLSNPIPSISPFGRNPFQTELYDYLRVTGAWYLSRSRHREIPREWYEIVAQHGHYDLFDAVTPRDRRTAFALYRKLQAEVKRCTVAVVSCTDQLTLSQALLSKQLDERVWQVLSVFLLHLAQIGMFDRRLHMS